MKDGEGVCLLAGDEVSGGLRFPRRDLRKRKKWFPEKKLGLYRMLFWRGGRRSK